MEPPLLFRVVSLYAAVALGLPRQRLSFFTAATNVYSLIFQALQHRRELRRARGSGVPRGRAFGRADVDGKLPRPLSGMPQKRARRVFHGDLVSHGQRTRGFVEESTTMDRNNRAPENNVKSSAYNYSAKCSIVRHFAPRGQSKLFIS